MRTEYERYLEGELERARGALFKEQQAKEEAQAALVSLQAEITSLRGANARLQAIFPRDSLGNTWPEELVAAVLREAMNAPTTLKPSDLQEILFRVRNREDVLGEEKAAITLAAWAFRMAWERTQVLLSPREGTMGLPPTS